MATYVRLCEQEGFDVAFFNKRENKLLAMRANTSEEDIMALHRLRKLLEHETEMVVSTYQDASNMILVSITPRTDNHEYQKARTANQDFR